MDDQRFDRFARAVATCRSRRQLLRLAAALPLLGACPSRGLARQAAQCDPDLTFCPAANACVDLQTDMANCGACGSVCESQLVPVACRHGECVRASCPEGIEYCGAVALCRNLAVDPEHCGACGHACASGVCIGGACAPAGGTTCAPGQVNCAGACVDTCCDNANCGACGTACPSGMICFEGVCDCPSGNCGPTTPPNTGAGAVPPPSTAAPLALAAAAMAALGSLWTRQRTTRLAPSPIPIEESDQTTL